MLNYPSILMVLIIRTRYFEHRWMWVVQKRCRSLDRTAQVLILNWDRKNSWQGLQFWYLTVRRDWLYQQKTISGHQSWSLQLMVATGIIRLVMTKVYEYIFLQYRAGSDPILKKWWSGEYWPSIFDFKAFVPKKTMTPWKTYFETVLLRVVGKQLCNFKVSRT